MIKEEIGGIAPLLSSCTCYNSGQWLWPCSVGIYVDRYDRIRVFVLDVILMIIGDNCCDYYGELGI